LPKLRSVAAIPAVDSAHWALSTVSDYDFPLSLIRWMLDFALAPLFPLVSCQAVFIQSAFFPNIWLAPVGFLVVQSIHIRRFDDDVGWMGALNSK
jgi:hypothetical protein